MLPSPSEYRLNEDQIVRSGSVCMARILGDYLTCDPRWKPHVYYEAQCERAPVVGKDLCKTCGSREQRKHKLWIGRITEDPLPHCHMLGTEWAKKCKWIGDDSPSPVCQVGDDSPSPASSVNPIMDTISLSPVKEVDAQESMPIVNPSEQEHSPDPVKPYIISMSIERILSYSFLSIGIGITLYHFLWCPIHSHL
jgi:hypothetical protein